LLLLTKIAKSAIGRSDLISSREKGSPENVQTERNNLRKIVFKKRKLNDHGPIGSVLKRIARYETTQRRRRRPSAKSSTVVLQSLPK
jgi:hypothetical protein